MVHVLTLDEVAEALRMSRRWVEGVVADGRLRSFLLGTHRRVTIAALEEFIRSCESDGEPVETEARPTTAARLPSLPPAAGPGTSRATLPVGLRPIASFEDEAKRLTGTGGRPSGSHNRQRRSRRNTSSTPEKPSTSGAGSSTRSGT